MRVKGGHVSTLLSSEGRRRRLKKRREEKERERKTKRETRQETREETYIWVLVSRSVRSEFDKTLYFGWTTTIMRTVVALIEQLRASKRIDVNQTLECARAHLRENPKRTLKEGTQNVCLLYTSPSPRDRTRSRMPSSA